MSMNIKNAETYRLAHELAQVTGESLTKAVTEAVRERLERTRADRPGSMAKRLLEIGKDCASRIRHVPEHGDLLYGEDGLPR